MLGLAAVAHAARPMPPASAESFIPFPPVSAPSVDIFAHPPLPPLQDIFAHPPLPPLQDIFAKPPVAYSPLPDPGLFSTKAPIAFPPVAFPPLPGHDIFSKPTAESFFPDPVLPPVALPAVALPTHPPIAFPPVALPSIMHEDIFAHPPVALPPLPDPNLFTKPPGLLSPFHAASPSYKSLVRPRTLAALCAPSNAVCILQECDALDLQLQLVSVALLDAVLEVCSVGLNSSVQVGLIKGSECCC